MPHRDLEWLNQNAGRAYPLAEDTSLVVASGPSAGPSTLPQDLLVDLKFMAPITTTVPPYKLGCISFTGILLSVLIVDGADTPLAGSTINVETVEKFMDLELATLHPGVTGVVTFGEGVDTVKETWVPGKYIFGIELEATVAVPYQPGFVTSLGDLKEEKNEDAILVGDVTLIPGSNISMQRVEQDNTIVLRLTSTAQFEPICERGCTKGNCNAGAITRVAGVAPHPETGRITLRSENGVELDIRDGKIIIDHFLKPADLCDNYDRAPSGPVGGLGPAGFPGRDGLCICDQCDTAGTGFTATPPPSGGF